MWISLLSAALLVPLGVAAELPENLSGTWRCDQSAQAGHSQQVTFVFKVSGTKFNGMMFTPSDREDVLNGVIDGNRITFDTHMEFYPPERKWPMTGDWSGEELKILPARPRPVFRDGKTMTFRKVSKSTEFVAPEGWGPAPRTLPSYQPLAPNGLALTPPMGWNSWNQFEDKVDDRIVREVADAMVASGMKDAGYIYLNIDDTWAEGRDSQGNIKPNAKFPDMKALADYVHSKGLKIGIYTSPGRRTCADYAASYGHEEQDARSYAAWGIDYLKYDWCSASAVYHPNDMKTVYRMMALALRKTGRPIIYSLCQYGWLDVGEWGSGAGGNLWRTTSDIEDNWESMSRIGFGQNGREKYAGPGHWNDPDMLEVGNGGMNATEYRTHMSLWAILAAPLLAGNDIRSMSQTTREILLNKDVIAVDQDKLGAQGFRIRQDGQLEVWKKSLSDGVAVGMFNRGTAPAKILVRWSELGVRKSNPRVHDLWAHKDVDAPAEFTADVPSHGVVMLTVK